MAYNDGKDAWIKRVQVAAVGWYRTGDRRSGTVWPTKFAYKTTESSGRSVGVVWVAIVFLLMA